MTRLQRIIKNMFTLPYHARQVFSEHILHDLENTIRESEKLHRGEIRLVVEHGLDVWDVINGLTARERAIDLFSHMRVWDTEENTGVLIYILFSEHQIEIIADRGIHRRVEEGYWQALCQEMENAFRTGHYREGTLRAIEDLTQTLKRYFPATLENTNELPNAPLVM